MAECRTLAALFHPGGFCSPGRLRHVHRNPPRLKLALAASIAAATPAALANRRDAPPCCGRVTIQVRLGLDFIAFRALMQHCHPAIRPREALFQKNFQLKNRIGERARTSHVCLPARFVARQQLGPQCPLYPQKRTLVERSGMSALCQKRTPRPWLELINSNRLLFRKLLPE
jgi:hypothetical protein